MVDDDPSIVAALREALAPHEIEVETAVDATAATAFLDSRRFCGLVLDLVLATGSGFDILRHIERSGVSLPTVVITQKLPSYVREMLNERHVKLVFPKPVDVRLLAVVVLGLCGIVPAES